MCNVIIPKIQQQKTNIGVRLLNAVKQTISNKNNVHFCDAVHVLYSQLCKTGRCKTGRCCIFIFFLFFERKFLFFKKLLSFDSPATIMCLWNLSRKRFFFFLKNLSVSFSFNNICIRKIRMLNMFNSVLPYFTQTK